MNTQEMRRLGLLPYEEDEVRATWHSGVTRRPRLERVPLPEMVLERTAVNVPSRRIVNGRVVPVEHGELTEMRQQLDDEIDRSIAEDFETVPEEPTLAQRAWRSFIRRIRG